MDLPKQKKEHRPEFTIICAILAHLYFVLIHPFADGNGRTARLIEFKILLGSGIPTPATHLLSNFYNSTRSRYYTKLDEASRTGKCIDFLEYAIEGLVTELSEQLTYIKGQQAAIIWKDFIYQAFGDTKSEPAIRQRTIALALSRESLPVPEKKIPEMTARLTKLYAKRQARTITRDLTKLVEKKLIRKVDGGYVVNKEVLYLLIPMSNNPELVNQELFFMHEYFEEPPSISE